MDYNPFEPFNHDLRALQPSLRLEKLPICTHSKDLLDLPQCTPPLNLGWMRQYQETSIETGSLHALHE